MWRGDGTAQGQRQRSIALVRWAPVLERGGVHAVSLLHGEVSNELARYNATHLNPLREFVDTRGHLGALAGAIGRPCWALIPHAPDGRYGQSG